MSFKKKSSEVSFFFDIKGKSTPVGGGGGGKICGLGPWRNDVLITCIAATLRGGKRIIAVFFP